MEIFLSKLLPLLVFPLGLACLLLLAAIVLLLARRRWTGLAVVVLAVAVVGVAGNGRIAHSLIRSLENDYPPMSAAEAPQADVIVLLGGGLEPPYPPRRYPDLNGHSDRLVHALRLYRAGKADRLLLSGGNVFPQPGLEGESHYARDLLGLWGIPAQAVVTENESRNTLENAEYSAAIIKERGWDKVLLVTSATHMARAERAFRHAGVDVIPAPTDFLAVDAKAPEVLAWIPTEQALSGTTHALREYLGHLWYWWRL